MAKTYKEIRDCVRTIVRKFCYEGADISSDEIGAKTIKDLNLTQDSHMPGVAPIEGFAIKLRECTDVDIPDLTGEELQKNLNWTVDTIAQLIYRQSQ
jgi:hypothetical protein